jgi:uncharacterized protein (TIGR00369 family)
MSERKERVWEEEVRGGYPDPSVLAHDGLERMRAAVRLKLPPPPIHHLFGLLPIEASPGAATFRMPASPWLQSAAAGYFPAGALALVADAALGGAIVTCLGPGRLLATSDLTLNFLRPATPESGALVARARVIHAGKSLGLSETTVEDGTGRLLAHGTSRCFLFDFPAPIGEPPALSVWKGPSYDRPDPYLRPYSGETLSPEVLDRMSGREWLRGHLAAELPQPPIHYLTGMCFNSAEDGSTAATMPATAWLNNSAATLYGGALAFFIDVVLSGAVQTTVAAGSVYSPLDLKVNFVRPAFADGELLTARARVVHRGRTLAVATGEVANAAGKTVLTATSSMLIMAGRSWGREGQVVPEEDAARPVEQERGGA